MLKIALGKGRILEALASSLQQAGDPLGQLLVSDTRKLILTDAEKQFEFIMVKPADLPVYVENAAADIGIIGKDVLMESAFQLYQLLDLRLSNCRMVLAGPPELKNRPYEIRRVATKYPKSTKKYFGEKAQPIDIIKLEGSIELAPLVGLSDAIVDIVESGRTLRDNGLVEYDTLCDISSRVVANKISYKLKNAEIEAFVNRIKMIMGG